MSASANEAGEAAVSIESAWEIDWVALDTSRDGNVPGPVWKPLRRDPSTGATTFMTHLPPNWHDPLLDWHPTTEEGFKLAGKTVLGDPAIDEGYTELGRGCYLYRPPGILHGPVSAPVDEGSTILQRMNGEMRILRYDGDEFPHAHLQPITDQHVDWPVAWNERLDTNALAWEPVVSGPWSGAAIKRLHRNRVTGGGAVLLQLPAGWSGAGSAARGPLEEFVVEGAMTAGGVDYRKWGYAYRPVGAAAGSYATTDGAVLFCWWDEADEL